MAKRQHRVPVDKMDEAISERAQLNFIQKNGAVILATPVENKSGILKVKNTKGHLLHLPLASITEIWAEEKVS